VRVWELNRGQAGHGQVAAEQKRESHLGPLPTVADAETAGEVHNRSIQCELNRENRQPTMEVLDRGGSKEADDSEATGTDVGKGAQS